VPGTWIEASGQRWKLDVFFVGMTISASLWVVIWLWPSASDNVRFGVLPGLAAFFGLLALVWFITSIRCSACRGRVGWYAVRRLEIKKWLHAVMFSLACPICGNPAQGSAEPPSRDGQN
jgi:hypothetical protein